MGNSTRRAKVWLALGAAIGTCCALVAVAVAANNNTAAIVQSVAKAERWRGAGGLAGAKKLLATVSNPKTLPWASFVPKTGPKAVRGKTIYIIELSSQFEGTRRLTNGAVAAAKALGWKTKVIDGQATVGVEAQGVASAVTSRASGIFLNSIDPHTLGSAVSTAVRAHIPIVTAFATGSTQMRGVSADVSNETYGGGQALAAYIAANPAGRKKIVILEDNSLALAQARSLGEKEGLKRFYPSAKIVAVQPIDDAHLPTQLPSLVASDIQRYGKDIYLVAPFDAAAQFMLQGLQQAQATDVPMVSMDANGPELDAMRKGQSIQADWAGALEWCGWGDIDELNRAFNNKPAVREACPSILLTRKTLPPAGKAFVPPYNYQKAYKNLWQTGHSR